MNRKQNYCKRFFYANGALTSKQLREAHNCFDFSICKFCYKTKELDHLCKLRWPKAIMSHNRLCFFNIIFNEDDNLDPYLALFYREEKERGNFTKYCFVNDTPFGFSTEIDENYLSYSSHNFFYYSTLKYLHYTGCHIYSVNTYYCKSHLKQDKILFAL